MSLICPQYVYVLNMSSICICPQCIYLYKKRRTGLKRVIHRRIRLTLSMPCFFHPNPAEGDLRGPSSFIGRISSKHRNVLQNGTDMYIVDVFWPFRFISKPARIISRHCQSIFWFWSRLTTKIRENPKKSKIDQKWQKIECNRDKMYYFAKIRCFQYNVGHFLSISSQNQIFEFLGHHGPDPETDQCPEMGRKFIIFSRSPFQL